MILDLARSRHVLAGLALAALAALAFYCFPLVLTQRIEPASIAHRGGNAYAAPAPQLTRIPLVSGLLGLHADSSGYPTVSKLQLAEDGKPLGPAHAQHAEIEVHGAGRFSHWGDGLILSASDNTNPASNGRAYAITYPVSVSWWIVIVLVAAAGYAASRRSPRLAAALGPWLLGLGCAALAVYLNWAFEALLVAPVAHPDSNTYLTWSLFRTWGYPAFIHAGHAVFGSWTYLPALQLNLLLASVFLLAYAVARAAGSRLIAWLFVCLAIGGGTMVLSAADMLTEAPFAAFAMAHIAFAMLYFGQPRWHWALPAGIALAAAVMIKSVALALVGPLALLAVFLKGRRRDLLAFMLAPAVLAWLLPSLYNLTHYGAFESSHAGGLALAGHVAWAIQPRPGSLYPEEARIVAESIAPELRKRPAAFGSALEYADYTANEYNVLLWANIVPRMNEYYRALRPSEPCTWTSRAACGDNRMVSLNRTLMQLSREAIAAEPRRYLYHVAVHDYALWRDAYRAPNDFLGGLDYLAGYLPTAYDPARSAYYTLLAPLPPFKSDAERAAILTRFNASAASRIVRLASLREAFDVLRTRVLLEWHAALALASLLASALVFRARTLSPLGLAVCHCALFLNAYFLGTALAQPSLVRYGATMQGVIAAWLVLGACLVASSGRRFLRRA